MAPKFGTSGVRGLVNDLTDDVVANYTRAFLAACPTGQTVHVGWDLRPSSPVIAETVMATICEAGFGVIREGALPTPALALAAMQQGHGAIMITGSHIPADRNGLKFYTPAGEITKKDEAAILGLLTRKNAPVGPPGRLETGTGAVTAYASRYVTGFGSKSLAGLKIGIYQHSSVARDLLCEVLGALGAEVVPLARSERFIPVDTEAVDPQTRTMLADWCRDHKLDALVSTDGDADRPMVCDGTGTVIPGDVLGVLTAQMIGAQVLCTPVSSNSMVTEMGFEQVHLTRIGSPYVIAAMEEVLRDAPLARVAGFEANGGFLTGFVAACPAGPLAPLMTRDSLLPIVAPLALARKRGEQLEKLRDTLPQRFTSANRIANVPTKQSQALIATLTEDPQARAAFFVKRAPESGIDTTDGLRVRFTDGCVVHLRPSGNAPECRCYAEADSPEAAHFLVEETLSDLSTRLPG